MRAMTTTTQRLTADDVWNMPEVPGKQFELVRGALIEMPTAGWVHGQIGQTIPRFFYQLPDIDDYGLAFGNAVGYLLARNPDTVLIPDVSFVRSGRVSAQKEDGYWIGAPDLAIEIASPSNRPAELHAKAQAYLAAGTSVVWLFWPTTREVDIMTSDGVTRRIGPDDDLVTPDFLPDGRIQVSALFPAPEAVSAS